MSLLAKKCLICSSKLGAISRFASQARHLVTFSSSLNQILKSIKVPNHVQTRQMFYEPPPETKDRILEDMDFNDQMKLSFKVLKRETKLLWEENRDLFTRDPWPIYPLNEVNKFWDLRNEEHFNSWRTSYDNYWDEGFSNIDWTRSKSGCALMSGYLDAKNLPKNGQALRTGWVNVTSPDAKRSFYRDARYDWENWTHLVMRVRGDGRTYALVIRCRGYFDITWFDLYTYGLYTHGGPYWQYVKIPFSKFVLTYKGDVQDNQEYIPLYNISSFGISLMDGNTGPFSLEIDYVGLLNDPTYTELSAYEHYYVKESPYKHE